MLPATERLPAFSATEVVWQPVSLGALFKLTGRSSWALGDPARRMVGMGEVERRARLYGLPPVRWPDPWPGHYLFAMRVATFAAERGVGERFALQAFRAAFQRGCDLGVEENVLRAAEAVGLDRGAVERGVEDPQIKLALRHATDTAQRLGVVGVPTLAIDGELYWGDDRLEEAAAHLVSSSPPA